MNTGQRTIVHFDLDTFFVSVERLTNTSLKGKPIIIGGTSDRGVVSSCSYEARQYGVHSAMPMKMAKNLCNDAIIIKGDMDQYSKYSRMVTDIIQEEAPVYEKASIDEHYLDITGMDRFFGCMAWTRELRQKIIQETGLPISYGLSINKTVAKIATGEAKPNGEKEVTAKYVKPFLYPLSIRKIPMIGKKTYQLLRSMGVIHIETLSKIPKEMVENLMGKNGLSIWKKANGIDHSPVQNYHEQKSMSSERTFDRDTIDMVKLDRLIAIMVEKLSFELRKQQKLTSCVTVKIRYSNFDTHSLQKHISYTSYDHHLLEIARQLFKKLYNRRMLIRLIGVKFSDLVYGGQQLNIFNDKVQLVDLYQSMDKIREKYGAKSIRRAIGLNESFKMEKHE
jgi:DNA polymerase-4